MLPANAEYNSLSRWDATKDSTESEIAYYRIIQNIIVRESNLIKFQCIASSLDDQYFKYTILRLKFAVKELIIDTELFVAKRRLIRNLQMELIVILAHVRGSSVTVIESIQHWRKMKKAFNLIRIEETASVFWENENYLLKMNTDFEKICEEYYIIKLWLGFYPNALIIPEFDKTQISAYLMKPAVARTSTSCGIQYQNNSDSSFFLPSLQPSLSTTSRQHTTFSVPSSPSFSFKRSTSTPILSIAPRKLETIRNSVKMNNIDNNNNSNHHQNTNITTNSNDNNDNSIRYDNSNDSDRNHDNINSTNNNNRNNNNVNNNGNNIGYNNDNNNNNNDNNNNINNNNIDNNNNNKNNNDIQERILTHENKNLFIKQFHNKLTEELSRKNNPSERTYCQSHNWDQEIGRAHV